MRHGPHTEADRPCPKRWTACGAEAVVGLALTPLSEVRAVGVNAHVRICAGGAGQPASLPRPQKIFGAPYRQAEFTLLKIWYPQGPFFVLSDRLLDAISDTVRN